MNPTPEQLKWQCLCYLCFPNAKEYCELLVDCWLFENEGRWGLMCQPGHRDDHVLLFFPEKPTPDPDPECDHEDDEIAKESDRWLDVVTEWERTVRMRPIDGHILVTGCEKAGWKDGMLLMWLFDYAGKWLIESEGANEQSGHHRVSPGDGGDSAGGEPQAQGAVDDGSGTGSANLA